MRPAPLLAAVLLLAGPALAETAASDHTGHAGTAAAASPATRAYLDAAAQMHGAMTIEMTGDADVDFARAMIPHHEGAVAMARIALEHGTDPEIRKLAEAVVAAQEAEIAWMKDWLAKKGR